MSIHETGIFCPPVSKTGRTITKHLLYPRSKLESDHSANFTSKILEQELEGYNFISSMNKADIFETLRAAQTARSSKVFIETSRVSSIEETENLALYGKQILN